MQHIQNARRDFITLADLREIMHALANVPGHYEIDFITEQLDSEQVRSIAVNDTSNEEAITFTLVG